MIFDKATEVDAISSIAGKDLVITKEGDKLVVVAFIRKIRLKIISTLLDVHGHLFSDELHQVKFGNICHVNSIQLMLRNVVQPFASILLLIQTIIIWNAFDRHRI